MIRLLAVVLLSCTPPGEVPSPDADALRVSLDQPLIAMSTTPLDLPELNAVGHRQMPRLRAPRVLPSPQSEPDHALSAILGTVVDARVDDSIGHALDERMEDFSYSEINAYGLANLSLDELYGEDALCERPAFTFEFDEGGTTYEARFSIDDASFVVGDLEPFLVAPWPRCVDALADNGGDVDAALADGDCVDYELHTFFPEGSDCRACIEELGDFDACVDADRCEAVAPVRLSILDVDGTEHVIERYETWFWNCAPDWLTPVSVFIIPDEDGTLPDLWDHSRWAVSAQHFYNPEYGGPYLYAYTSEWGFTHGHTMAGGLKSWIHHIREKGTDEQDWYFRQYYVDAIEVGDWVIDRHWAYNPGSGSVSAPTIYTDTTGDGVVDGYDEGVGFGQIWGSGIDPTRTRPDGQSLARDYVAARILKQSSTIDGIWITYTNHNRCEEDAWVEVPDGSWHCTRTGPPVAGWHEDVEVWNASPTGQMPYEYGMVTIGSTGLPDPLVPGDYVIHLASSPALSNPDWEDCTHPHTFQVDSSVSPDRPSDWDGDHSLTVHTYRFGKDADDIRLVLGTAMWRGYCPDGSVGRSME